MSAPRPSLMAHASLLALVAAAIVAVDPRGDFPLDDDWNFALTTWRFAETGELVYSRFTAMTLKTQVLWGALWTRLFGESFEVLRASTLFLFALTVLVFYRWARDLELPQRAVWISTIAFAVHPIVFWSAFTYMTQVPFLLLSIVALRCFDIGLRHTDRRWIAAGAAAVIGAYFLRQTGLVLAVAPLVTIWRRRHDLQGARGLAIIAATPIALFVLLACASDWLSGYPGQILEHFEVWQVPAAALPVRAAQLVSYYSFFNFQNAALFFLPLTIAFVLTARPESRRERLALAALVIAGLALAVHMINKGLPMPYFSYSARFEVHPGNVFVNLGLGPQTLPDGWVWDMEPPFPISDELSYGITVVAGVLGGFAAWALFLAWHRAPRLSSRQRSAAELAVVHSLAATASLFVSGIYFDRYCVDSLWSLALLLPILTNWDRIVSLVVTAAAVILTAAFSVLGTQEYLRWNRARWDAVAELRRNGVRLEQLDGGYEVNQYLIGGFDGPVHLEKYGYSVIDNEYVIAFRRVPGYRLVASRQFTSFLGFRRGSVLTLRREESRATPRTTPTMDH